MQPINLFLLSAPKINTIIMDGITHIHTENHSLSTENDSADIITKVIIATKKDTILKVSRCTKPDFSSFLIPPRL